MIVISHILLILFFCVNIIISIKLKLLNEKINLEANKIIYIKVGILFVLWVIYLVTALVLPLDDMLFNLIYALLSGVNFIICIILVRKGQSIETSKNFGSENIYKTWKESANDLNLKFRIRRHSNIDLPIIYGNISNRFIEIFPFNKEFNLKKIDKDTKLIIYIRVFDKVRNINNIKLFSYQEKFKEQLKRYSYMESHIDPSWTDLKLPELPREFPKEADNIIKSFIRSFNQKV